MSEGSAIGYIAMSSSAKITNRTSLRWLMIRYMSLVALVCVGTMVAGYAIYIAIWLALHPRENGFDDLSWFDFLVPLVVLIVGLALAASMGWRLGRKFIPSLHSMREAAQAISDGNLSIRVKGNDFDMGEIDDLVDGFNKMAEMLDRAHTDLVYQNSAIAHELRTPLTVLRGRLQGLHDGLFEPSPPLYANLISHVDALSRIVDDLRTLALFNADRLELKIERFDLGLELQNLVDGLSGELEMANMQVECAFTTLYVQADRVRIRQVALAAIDNACRYASGSKLRISARKGDEGTTLDFSDSGPGLADEQIGHAFEQFWRADDSRTRSKGGSGLGLSIVKAVAEAHGGQASVTRNGDRGLTISVQIP